MSVESLDNCTFWFHVPVPVDTVVHFSSLAQACLYQINFTVVLRYAGRDDVLRLSSTCVNVSLTASTAPPLPATPSPPSRIDDFRNGSLLIHLTSDQQRRRRRRDAEVMSSRLIVVEYTDVVTRTTLSQLVTLGLTDTYDQRAAGSVDPLVSYVEATRRKQSFYVTGEVDLNVTQFMIGDPYPAYVNPPIDLSRPCRIYVVHQNSLDGIHRRAVSEYVVVRGVGAAATGLLPWWVWLLIFVAVLVLVAVVILAIVLCWKTWRCRSKARRMAYTDVKVRGTTDDAGKRRSSPSDVGALAVSYLDSVVDDRRQRRVRVSSGRAGFDSYSDADGEWSFAEPRPMYDADTTLRRRSRCIPTTELRQYCERRLWADRGRTLADEFSLLPDGFTGPVSTAIRASNAPANRTQDCVPYDHNRVRLSSGRYVNASVVRTIGRRRFIVTQFPTVETLAQFWEMVWERNVDVIVALTALDEPDCEPYWPAELNRAATWTDGISVELAGVGVLAHFVVRELLLERSGELGRRRIAHWQYTWWCDSSGGGAGDREMSIPCHPVDFVDFVRRVRDDDDYADAGRVLVHCGSGGGRSGLYLAVDALLDQGTSTGVVDVVKCVSLLRTERCSLVHSLSQYNFVYQCLCEQFDHPRTRFSAQNFVAQPRPDVFDLVFMPSYFDRVRPGVSPAVKRRTRSPFSVCVDDAALRPSDEGNSGCTSDVDDKPAVTFDGFVQRSAFVVSRCPRPLDADEFWDVVTESAVSSIVSLGVVASLPGHELLFPQRPGASIRTHRHLVECKSVERSSESVYVTAELELSTCVGGLVLHESRRSIKLFELVSWPGDCSLPPVSALIQFTTLVRCRQRRGTCPLLVFGTSEPAGDGRRHRSRAAVFVALWRLMEQAELDAVVDVFAATRLTCLMLPSALINQVALPCTVLIVLCMINIK